MRTIQHYCCATHTCFSPPQRRLLARLLLPRVIKEFDGRAVPRWPVWQRNRVGYRGVQRALRCGLLLCRCIQFRDVFVVPWRDVRQYDGPRERDVQRSVRRRVLLHCWVTIADGGGMRCGALWLN